MRKCCKKLSSSANQNTKSWEDRTLVGLWHAQTASIGHDIPRHAWSRQAAKKAGALRGWIELCTRNGRECVGLLACCSMANPHTEKLES
uniref:Uncharacterized protein n=1 Tax=Arundo donax TaxID=35708 RepID=A0A0A9H231_ARUDO